MKTDARARSVFGIRIHCHKRTDSQRRVGRNLIDLFLQGSDRRSLGGAGLLGLRELLLEAFDKILQGINFGIQRREGRWCLGVRFETAQETQSD